MAHIDSGGGKGRNVNTELNLVPVIDLMSVLITFLLLTAVWTQISMMQIGSSQYGKKNEDQDLPTPPPPLADLVLKLDVKTTGYVLTVGQQVMSFPLINNEYDDSNLLAQLQKVKAQFPEKQDSVVSMEDTLTYDRLIRAMDAFLVAGFPKISVATGGSLMAIYKPGQRFRYHRILGRNSGKRGVTAVLSLTAMVDMFTVLVIFLLQNYNSQEFLIYTPKEIVLPEAVTTKELKPAFIISISNKEIYLDQDVVATFEEVRNSEDWILPKLHEMLKLGLAKKKDEYERNLQNQIRSVVDNARGEKSNKDPYAWNKVTVQADKDIDFLSIKKVMFTVTDAGAGEINFAVVKKEKPSLPTF